MHPRLCSLFVALLSALVCDAQVFPDDGSRWLYCYFPTLDPVPLYEGFKREVGDTLWMQEVRYVLTAEDQVEFGGELKRRLYWSRWDPVSQEDSEDVWVEGVGSTRRLLYPLYQVLYGLAPVNGVLDCFLDQETVVLESGCPVQNPEDCFSLGITEYEITDIRTYPNPVETLLHVDVSELTGAHRHATLVNTHGRIVANQPVPQAARSLRMDVSGIPSGVYLFTLCSEKGAIRKRVVVQ